SSIFPHLSGQHGKTHYRHWAAGAIAAATLLAGILLWRGRSHEAGPAVKPAVVAEPDVHRSGPGGGSPSNAKPGARAAARVTDANADTAGAAGPDEPEPPRVARPVPTEATAVAADPFTVEGRSNVLVGADAAGYQAWIDRMRASRYRPTF